MQELVQWAQLERALVSDGQTLLLIRGVNEPAGLRATARKPAHVVLSRATGSQVLNVDPLCVPLSPPHRLGRAKSVALSPFSLAELHVPSIAPPAADRPADSSDPMSHPDNAGLGCDCLTQGTRAEVEYSGALEDRTGKTGTC